jgi:hypothetical protein
LRATFASTWPGQLAELLDLDQRRETVTAIVGLTVAPDSRTDVLPKCH